MTATDATLKRSLNLPLLVLYGLGVTVGAGIYVLVGATAARAGIYAPASFVVSAVVMAFTALSFGELSARFPVSAGEAAYVREGFGSSSLSFVTGALVIASGTISSSAIALGCAGYLREFVDLPATLLIPAIIVVVGLVAAWGILESVMLAALFTVIEIGGLCVIIAAGFAANPGIALQFGSLVPPLDLTVWFSVFSAGLLAFFAFIGFEDLVNVAEEARNPKRDLPIAIIATLVATTVIYVLVVSVSVLSLPAADLAASQAPLADVFRRVTGASPVAITVIAVFATLNTMIVQVIMVSRVIYGMSSMGTLPRVLSTVDPRTRTPLFATALVIAAVLVLALGFPLEGLAEMTSRVALVIFTLVNLALVRLKFTQSGGPVPQFAVPSWVPVVGAVTCACFLVTGFLV